MALEKKKSNGGTQWYQQDRVYSGSEDIISMCLPASIPGGSYWYALDIQSVGTVSPNSLIGGRVIGIDGTCFTIMAGTHGYGMGNILDNRFAVCVDDLYANREPRYYLEEN